MTLTSADRRSKPSISVVIPCLNEELGIADVVRDLKRTLPDAQLIVIDNASTDQTASIAAAAGAEVIYEGRPGKGYAVEASLSLIDTDVVIMIDGDNSYPAEGAKLLLEAYRTSGADMVTGIRCPVAGSGKIFRPWHQAGSSAFATALRMVFGFSFQDIFSGLRLFSRRFYKNVPLLGRGFELEMELNIQCITKGFRFQEVKIPFSERAADSASKLRTVEDGLKILRLLLILFRDFRPYLFFGLISFCFFCASLATGALPIYEYMTTGFVGRFPLAILAASLMNIAFFIFLTGITLESSLRHQREAFQIRLRNSS